MAVLYLLLSGEMDNTATATDSAGGLA
jgi:hypothetical protein